MLQLAIRLGYVCTKVHTLIEFREIAFVEDYIRKNIKFRNDAKTEFEKELFKLFNNIIYGKMCQKKDDHFEYRFCNNMDEAKRIIHTGRFHGQRNIYDSELVGLKLQYNEMTFNSPLPVACAILDLSKVIMYQFYYEGMKPFFDPDKYNCGPPEEQKCRMCYTGKK